MGVYLHAFLTSALDGGEWSASLSSRFTSRKRAPGWVPKSVSTRWRKEKFPAPTGTQNAEHPAQLLYGCWYHHFLYSFSCDSYVAFPFMVAQILPHTYDLITQSFNLHLLLSSEFIYSLEKREFSLYCLQYHGLQFHMLNAHSNKVHLSV